MRAIEKKRLARGTFDPRCVVVPAQHRKKVQEMAQRMGASGAAKQLGIGRSALLGVAAVGECMPGTAALLREALDENGDIKPKESE